MSRPFNPEMLILARESRGLTQKEFAHETAISQGELSKIETGLREPFGEVVSRLASRLGYASGLFFIDDRIVGSSGNCPYYRKRKSASVKTIRQALAVANIRRIQISRLLISGVAELDTQKQFRRIDIEDHPAGPANIARTVRAMWSLPPGPIQNLTRAVEDTGGIVFRCDLSCAAPAHTEELLDRPAVEVSGFDGQQICEDSPPEKLLVDAWGRRYRFHSPGRSNLGPGDRRSTHLTVGILDLRTFRHDADEAFRSPTGIHAPKDRTSARCLIPFSS